MPAPELPIDPELPGDDPADPSTTSQPAGPPQPQRRARLDTLAAIGAGGFVGTLARYQLGVAWPTPSGHFPAATFTVNTSGAFAIGVLAVVILQRFGSSPYLRPFLIVGLLGGWTTMSTLAVDAVTLSDDGHWPTAAGYLGATLIGGIGAVVAGMVVARAVMPHWPAPDDAR